MPQAQDAELRHWIETFRSRSRLDLHPLWQRPTAEGGWRNALTDPWGCTHRPDWHARGLIVWPRGGLVLRLAQELICPPVWRSLHSVRARLVLSWWAEAAELRVDGRAVHRGDLFDTACRWCLPERWRRGEPLLLELEMRSPVHDDGALIHSRIELEPAGSEDPNGLLLATALELEGMRRPWPAASFSELEAEHLARGSVPPPGEFQLIGHAHLDLAWLWPVAETWQAAERTFRATLQLMERHPQLHFGHSTPALYAWLQHYRPELFDAIRQAMRSGRWEPLNGPWVETDCVLIGTASLLRQFQEGQTYSRQAFPEWKHALAWLPDSFGFSAGLPAVAEATGVHWFCTHKLAWNASNPFPHRLFRWRARCGAELLALMTAPIGTNGDPVAMERYRLAWQSATGMADALWMPGVGDHGGGPTAEMLEQLELWQAQPCAAPQRHGTVRAYLEALEPLRQRLPVWRDELYLELHRGCPTSRPDQKRHNRSLERLLREADLAAALLWAEEPPQLDSPPLEPPAALDWRPLLFQQFHDILPGTSIPEVFEQAEPQWRQARRDTRAHRDTALARWLPAEAKTTGEQVWWLARLHPLPAAPLTLRLPRGLWTLGEQELPAQPAPGGGQWTQVPVPDGVAALRLRRVSGSQTPLLPAPPQQTSPLPPDATGRIEAPVRLERLETEDGDRWRLGNGLIWTQLGSMGVEQIWGPDRHPQLSSPLEWRRWRDQGEFWDAWDLAVDYREHPLSLEWEPGPAVVEQGPLCCRLLWHGRCGASSLRLDVQLRAASPWLELTLSVDWRQRHELLRLELPLQQPALRWAADLPGGVLERPALALTPREEARWEVPAISWVASQAAAGGLAVLLDGPQGVSGTAERLGVSLLRAPTWPDPGADNGWQRLRLALLPCSPTWRQAAVPAAAVRFREPVWLRPAASAAMALQEAAPPISAREDRLTILTLGHADLQMVALRADREPGVLRLTVQNLSPCRHVLALGDSWEVLERTDGLGADLSVSGDGSELLERLRPWELASWRIRHSTEALQSSPQSS